MFVVYDFKNNYEKTIRKIFQNQSLFPVHLIMVTMGYLNTPTYIVYHTTKHPLVLQVKLYYN